MVTGHSVQIINTIEGDEHNSFSLNLKALEDVLLQNNIRDKNICVVSVAGGFRKGKSFLLDFFLKYLSSQDKEKWLDDKESPLVGFPWRGGSDRDTTGILIWSEPFIIKLDNGEEAALILMDTQGSFDSQSTVKQCATVFALSTMLSSVQVYNLHGNIQEDDLQNLQLFTEYGRLAMADSDGEKPFQNLQFLIRDWPFPYEQEFGFIGGQSLLDKRLEVTEKMANENRNLRNHIKTCFDKIQCFLMPHPGMKVASDPKFDGKLADIDENFLKKINEFVPSIFSTKNLKVKKIFGTNVTGRTWVEYLKSYMKIYQSDSLPEVKTLLNATAEANNLSAMIQSKEYYTKLMNQVCGPESGYINPNVVETAHLKNKEEALLKFKSTKKMGSSTYCMEYQNKLSQSLDALGDDFKKNNEQKNILGNFKTPATLILILIVSYVLGGIIDIIGVDFITKLFMFPFYIALIALLTWTFLVYSGRAPSVLEVVDESTEMFVDKLILPYAYKVLTGPVANARR